MKRSTANNQRPVTQFTLEGIELKTFDSIVIAGRKTGIDRRTINNCVLGKVRLLVDLNGNTLKKKLIEL